MSAVPSLGSCPDCSAQAVEGHLNHDDTCPLGLGYDEIQADDRFWFALRPHETVRRRPPHWAEIAELRALRIIPPAGEVLGHIVITRLADGIRSKRFDELYIVLGAP